MGLIARACFAAAVCGMLFSSFCRAAGGEGVVWQEIDGPARVALSEDANMSDAPGNASLTTGSLMIEPRDAYCLHTPLAEVLPKRHALIFVRVRQGCEHVFVLLGNASIRTSGHADELNAGEEAVLADHEPTVQELLGEDYIGRRRLRMVKLPDGKSVGVSEFSLVHACQREPVLYRLMHSSDPHDRALRDRLIKTAAVLNAVTGRHGSYITGQ